VNRVAAGPLGEPKGFPGTPDAMPAELAPLHGPRPTSTMVAPGRLGLLGSALDEGIGSVLLKGLWDPRADLRGLRGLPAAVGEFTGPSLAASRRPVILTSDYNSSSSSSSLPCWR